MRGWLWLATSLMPAALAAQEPDPELRAQIDALLEDGPGAEVLDDLDERFMHHFHLLVPDLTPGDAELVAGAAARAFDPARVRADVAALMTPDAPREHVQAMLELRASGPEAEMTRMADAFEPAQPLDEFVRELGTPPAARLQLMASLAAAQGSGDLGLLLEDALRAGAHRFVTWLGGEPDPIEPLDDAAWEDAYRQRVLMRSLELLHRLQPVPDELVREVAVAYDSPAGVWYVDTYLAALQQAVLVATERVAELTTTDESAVASESASSGLPCRARACGLVVVWQGRPPTEVNRRFGASAELEARVREHLMMAGYQLLPGRHEDGLTIRLRPRTMLALCDFMSGTDNSGCVAIDNVRIDFLGADPDFGTPDGFVARNRCQGDGVMDVRGVAALVAMQLHHVLSIEPDGDMPRC